MAYHNLQARTTLPNTGETVIPPPLHTFRPFSCTDCTHDRQLDYIITSLQYQDHTIHHTDTSNMALYKTDHATITATLLLPTQRSTKNRKPHRHTWNCSNLASFQRECADILPTTKTHKPQT